LNIDLVSHVTYACGNNLNRLGEISVHFNARFRLFYFTLLFYLRGSLFLDGVVNISDNTETTESGTIEEDAALVSTDCPEQSSKAPMLETTPNLHVSLAEERARKFEKIKHNLANPLTSGKIKKSGKKEEKKEEKSVWQSSGPRKQSEITVSFTPRYFPSAARESTAADEEAVSWKYFELILKFAFMQNLKCLDAFMCRQEICFL